LFDAPFFSLTAQEATSMDSQQRLLLECTFEALGSAGIPKREIVGNEVGVFIGGSFKSTSPSCSMTLKLFLCTKPLEHALRDSDTNRAGLLEGINRDDKTPEITTRSLACVSRPVRHSGPRMRSSSTCGLQPRLSLQRTRLARMLLSRTVLRSRLPSPRKKPKRWSAMDYSTSYLRFSCLRKKTWASFAHCRTTLLTRWLPSKSATISLESSRPIFKSWSFYLAAQLKPWRRQFA
jgi:Beta-ketoacyl synthase, N-terminal domain